eukprot:6992082-Pyramimonas_sp.AAC.1
MTPPFAPKDPFSPLPRTASVAGPLGRPRKSRRCEQGRGESKGGEKGQDGGTGDEWFLRPVRPLLYAPAVCPSCEN